MWLVTNTTALLRHCLRKLDSQGFSLWFDHRLNSTSAIWNSAIWKSNSTLHWKQICWIFCSVVLIKKKRNNNWFFFSDLGSTCNSFTRKDAYHSHSILNLDPNVPTEYVVKECEVIFNYWKHKILKYCLGGIVGSTIAFIKLMSWPRQQWEWAIKSNTAYEV